MRWTKFCRLICYDTSRKEAHTWKMSHHFDNSLEQWWPIFMRLHLSSKRLSTFDMKNMEGFWKMYPKSWCPHKNRELKIVFLRNHFLMTSENILLNGSGNNRMNKILTREYYFHILDPYSERRWKSVVIFSTFNFSFWMRLLPVTV